MRKLIISLLPVLAATFGVAAQPGVANAQQKALVYCQDTTPCNNVVSALSATWGSANVARTGDGTSGTIRVTDAAAIAAYSVFVVPSSQGATYTQLRDATVQSSLRSVLKGRVVAWSGTPDVSPDAAGNKARVIRNLADWAKSASGKLPGVVVLLDLSTDATRYGWLQGIADVSLTPYATSALGPAWSFNNIAWKTAAPGNSIADAIKAGVTTDYGTAVQVGFSTATVSPGIVAAEAPGA